MEILPKLKGEYPDLTQRDIMSLGAKAWSTIPAQKKQDLEALAAKEKAQYDIVLKSYEADKALGNSAAPSTSPSSVPAPETAAPPIVKAKRAKKAPVPVPETAPVEPVVAAPTPAPTPTPGQEEKKRKKEKKSKKEPPTPSEESAKKKKVCIFLEWLSSYLIVFSHITTEVVQVKDLLLKCQSKEPL